MRVAVRVDTGPLIGGGHAMRCLTLADALAERGAAVTFVSSAMPEALAGRIEASGHELARLPVRPGLCRHGGNWHEPPLDAAEQAADVEATAAAASNADWLVVDHYLLDARWHSAARAFTERLVVIDDLANRPYDCDLLVDEGAGRSAADYAGLVPQNAIVLTGAHHALLRPEFVRERPAALKRRAAQRTANSILISLGTTDPNGLSVAAVEQVLARAPCCSIDVVVSEEAESLPHLRKLATGERRISIHVNSNRMAELMRNADLAVGAAGTTSWERCCLGLPAVALVLAENQRANADALESAGAAIKLDQVGDIGTAVASLIDDDRRLLDMSAAAFKLTDGLGAPRVVQAMLGAAAERRTVRA